MNVRGWCKLLWWCHRWFTTIVTHDNILITCPHSLDTMTPPPAVSVLSNNNSAHGHNKVHCNLQLMTQDNHLKICNNSDQTVNWMCKCLNHFYNICQNKLQFVMSFASWADTCQMYHQYWLVMSLLTEFCCVQIDVYHEHVIGMVIYGCPR